MWLLRLWSLPFVFAGALALCGAILGPSFGGGAGRSQRAARELSLYARAELLSYRHRLATFQLETLKNIYFDLAYNAGLFSKSPLTRSLADPLHGVGAGLSLDLRFIGPVRFMFAKTEDRSWESYFSVGHGF